MPTTFRTLTLKSEYRSLTDDVVNDFYVPVLSHAVLYQRAVGFFASSALLEISVGLSRLLQNGGSVQLVVSPYLQPEDIEAMEQGYLSRKEALERAIMGQFHDPQTYFESERLNLLATLVAKGRMDIKVAFTRHSNAVGMYHEKLGLVHDAEENIIAFTGSMNESRTAFSSNYEAVDIFCSWTHDRERVDRKQQVFRSLWHNQERGLETVDFPQVALAKLLSFRRMSVDPTLDDQEYPQRLATSEGAVTRSHPDTPDFLTLYDYQVEAIRVWEKNGFRGIFDMATGTGKTYTALGAVARLNAVVNGRLGVIIVCPYQHLVEQWIEDVRQFHMNPIVGYSASSQTDWKRRLKEAVAAFNLGVTDGFSFVTTNATFATPYVSQLIASIRRDAVLVIDEAHNFGATLLQQTLPESIPFRLALSATLERHMDPDGTAQLYEYFGEKCIEYALDRAIAEDKLTPYVYHPVPVYLTTEELAAYRQLTKQLAKHMRNTSSGPVPADTAGKMLLIRRARLIAGAANKIAVLEQRMREWRDARHLLVYCGATSLGDEDQGSQGEIKQIDAVVALLGNQLKMNVAKFTAEESAQERVQIKSEFADGRYLQALVAIRCLDEGVNIPSVHVAFILASSTNPKEYIQRRGRVLRKAPGKDRAIIYDFVTLPRPLEEVRNFPLEESRGDLGLIRREVARMKEFATIAQNPSETDQLIGEIESSYHLAVIEGGISDV